MLHAARSLDLRNHLGNHLRNRLRHGLGPALGGLAGALVTLSLVGCPSSSPSPHSTKASAQRAPEGTTEPVPAPAAPAAATQLAPGPANPSPTPETGAPLPPALAAPGVRPVLQSLWRAIEAVDGGDAEALSGTMLPDGRWFPPGSPNESVPLADLPRAMNPWITQDVGLDVRRVIDLGGPFVVQLVASSRVGEPPNRHELVLVVEARNDRISMVRHFGDPLGPVRMGPDATDPLDLGPVGEVALERGHPERASMSVATALTEALDGRNDAAAQALLAEDVVLHDVIARHTRRGREHYLAGYQAMLGDAGHLAVDRQHSASAWVIMEGAVYGRQSDQGQEFGFADVHRVVDGAIVETWHYVNRRGWPPRQRAKP